MRMKIYLNILGEYLFVAYMKQTMDTNSKITIGFQDNIWDDQLTDDPHDVIKFFFEGIEHI